MQFDVEKELLKSRIVKVEDILMLNVGGETTNFTVTKSLLTSVPGSALEAMFSGRHTLTKLDDRVFIDRDPVAFRGLINYLRNNMQLPTQLD